jgi:hypothetical protein
MPWAAAAAVVAAGVSADASKSAASKAAGGAKAAGALNLSEGRRAEKKSKRLFGDAQQNLLAGSSAAADIFNQSMAGQQGALSQGNLNAQGTVSSTLPQIQAALFGQPINFGTFQPRSVDFAQSFANPINKLR